MNKEAGQIQESKWRHNYREDLDPEKLDWLFWLSHNWKWYFAVNRMSGLNSTQWLLQKSAEAHASGNREAFTNEGRWNANWWTTSWWEKSRWKWNDEVWRFFFSLRISHPRSGNCCVRDGRCTHSVSHAQFFWHIFLCVAYRHRAHAWGVCGAHVISRHLTLSMLVFPPPSLLFPHGHFGTTFLSAQSLPGFTRSESADQAHFRTSGGEFGHLADPAHSTGYEPKEFDKITSADGDTTPINDPNYDTVSDFSKITRENTGLFGVSTVLEASVSHVSLR